MFDLSDVAGVEMVLSCEIGCYSPADWERIYAAYQAGEIQYPWEARGGSEHE